MIPRWASSIRDCRSSSGILTSWPSGPLTRMRPAVDRRSKATRSCTPTSAPATSSAAAASSTASRCSNGAPPNAACTCSASRRPLPTASAWSSSESASRAEPLARRAMRSSGLGIGVDPLAAEDVGEVADQLAVREQRELEVLRPRTQRGQHLLRIGGGEHEHDVRGRLLERLQQRVRRRRREHVHLVDDVHLAPARGADPEVHALDELAHRVDTVVRRGVELDEVEEGARGDRFAVLADAARLAVVAEVQAVERPGEEAGGGGLAGAARARRRGTRGRPGRRATACRSAVVTWSWPTSSANFCGRYLRYRLCDATAATLPMPTRLERGPLAPYRVRRDERP